MKKIYAISVILFVVISLLAVPGCKKSPAAGKDLALLKLVPMDAQGIVYANIKQALTLDLFKKQVETLKKETAKPGEKKAFENYEDFVAKTGIDPEKDIHSAVLAILNGNLKELSAGSSADILLILDLNYDRAKILGMLKEQASRDNLNRSEETYKGAPILNVQEKNGQEFSLAFLNDKTISFGKPAAVKQAIDLSQGKGASFINNAKMKPYFETVKPGVILSFAFALPNEVKKVHDMGMMQIDLTKAEIVFGFLEHIKNTWTGDLELISHNETANAQLVSTLNIALGALGMSSPEAGELVKNIAIGSTADAIKIKFSISEELARKLQEKTAGQKPVATPPTTE